MNVLSLVGRMTVNRYNNWKGTPQKPVRTPAPLGLTQGATVEIPLVPFVLAQGAGAVIGDLDAHQQVVSVGKLAVFGESYTRSYLSDGRSYIETVASKLNPAQSIQTRLYTLHTEKMPSNDDEWAFLLGKDAKTLRDTNTETDVVIEEAVPALIGWPLFQLEDDKKGSIVFPRAWEPGEAPLDPVEVEETITDAAGNSFVARHMMMVYGRALDDGRTGEFLIAEAIETDEGAVFNASVGLDVDPAGLSILPPAP
jgi:hypothetical protein